MAVEEEIKYSSGAGSKIEYSATKDESYIQLKGLTAIPQMGQAPASIDTTTLDNLKQKTSIKGLEEAQNLEFKMNMEDPDVNANINKVIEMMESGTKYWYRITRGNGIVHTIQGEPYIMFNEVGIDAIDSFTLGIVPNTEREDKLPTVTPPSGS